MACTDQETPMPSLFGPRTQEVLPQLSIDEKAAITAGSGFFNMTGVEHLGIPNWLTTDGPNEGVGPPKWNVPAAQLRPVSEFDDGVVVNGTVGHRHLTVRPVDRAQRCAFGIGCKVDAPGDHLCDPRRPLRPTPARTPIRPAPPASPDHRSSPEVRGRPARGGASGRPRCGPRYRRLRCRPWSRWGC